MDLQYTSAADDEITEATAWYFEHGGEDIAVGFILEVDRVAALTQENPRLWPEVEPGIRRVVLRNFPFSLIYTIEPDRVLVLAVAHHRRQAGYWRNRTPR